MCTVTFVPLSPEQFVFTSSRDVDYKRKIALEPKLYSLPHRDIIYPRDEHAGGTWFVTSKKYTLCLINGAFEAHNMFRDFVKSRGLIVLDAIGYDSIDLFIENYDLTGVEPFTLLIIEHGKSLRELRWDETQKHLDTFAYNEPRIWSSATLYDAEVRAEREVWFSEWLEENPASDIFKFHKYGGFSSPEDDVLMDRGFIGTVSITSLLADENSRSITYFDQLEQTTSYLSHDF